MCFKATVQETYVFQYLLSLQPFFLVSCSKPDMSHPQEMEAMDAELADMAILEIDEISMVDRIVLAYVHLRLQEWRRTRYHDRLCGHGPCRCGARMSFGGVKVVLAGDFGQLPPVAVAKEKTLLCPEILRAGQDQSVGNLGLRLFRQIRAVFRLRRIHRQTGQSHYKDSLLRLRDAAHTKEDVDLWRTHDLSSTACALSVQERQDMSKTAVHLFCENRRAGEFNGRSLGEALLTPSVAGRALRIWSQDSSPAVERHAHDQYGGLRRVLHLAEGVPVMLLSNLRTVWNLVNGLRGRQKMKPILLRSWLGHHRTCARWGTDQKRHLAWCFWKIGEGKWTTRSIFL